MVLGGVKGTLEGSMASVMLVGDQGNGGAKDTVGSESA